jgi:hypothetical protein
MRLLPQAVRDALIRELVETTRYVDEHFDPVEFDELPVIDDPEGDEDSR